MKTLITGGCGFIGDEDKVASGKLEKLKIYGNDYPTPDGTGIRDYIHVVDLAKGHTAALNKLTTEEGKLITANLGTGTGYSVFQLLKAFEHSSRKKIPYEIVERREGDVAECYASTEYAQEHLKWKTEKNLEQMCLDAWRYQKIQIKS